MLFHFSTDHNTRYNAASLNLMLGADVAGVQEQGIRAIITSRELVGSNTAGALSAGRTALVGVAKPTACLHLGQVVAAREGHIGVEVPRHVIRAGTATFRSRGEGPVDVKGTARDQLLGSNIAGLQKSRELRREDVPRLIRGQGGDRFSRVCPFTSRAASTTVVARILASVVITKEAPTYETGAEATGAEATGAEKPGAETEAARTRRATFDARIVRGQ
jgi:hypothetical protein